MHLGWNQQLSIVDNKPKVAISWPIIHYKKYGETLLIPDITTDLQIENLIWYDIWYLYLATSLSRWKRFVELRVSLVENLLSLLRIMTEILCNSIEVVLPWQSKDSCSRLHWFYCFSFVILQDVGIWQRMTQVNHKAYREG